MSKYYDADGNEVEAFSKEEYDTLKTSVDDLTKKIEEGNMSEGQKARLLKERDDAIAAQKTIEDKFSKELTDLKTTLIGGFKDKAFNALAGSDEDLRKKLDFEFNQFTGDALTEADIAERAKKAYMLATGEQPKASIMDNITGAGGHGGGAPNAVAKEESETSKEIRKSLGISDETVEKYKEKLNNGK